MIADVGVNSTTCPPLITMSRTDNRLMQCSDGTSCTLNFPKSTALSEENWMSSLPYIKWRVDSPFLSSWVTRWGLSWIVVSVNVDLLAPLSKMVSVVPFMILLRAGHMYYALYLYHMSAPSPISEFTGDDGGVVMMVNIVICWRCYSIWTASWRRGGAGRSQYCLRIISCWVRLPFCWVLRPSCSKKKCSWV